MQQMKKIYIVLILLPIYLFTSCKEKTPQCLLSFQSQISNMDTGKVIDFSSINCFNWDYIVVIAPEFSKRALKNNLDLPLPYSVRKKSQMYDRNPYWSLIFIANKKPIHTIFIDQKDLTFDKYYYSFEGSKDFFYINKTDKFVTYIEDYYINGDKSLGVRKL